ncbi:MAG: hypothetical protein ABI556_07735 [Gemmatimonadales bacterium]
MKQLPSFSPSPQFADKVMARVRIPGAVPAPAPGEIRVVAPAYRAPIERRSSVTVAQPDIRRSIPARIAATAMITSLGVTMTAVALAVFFDLNLFVLISRIFGASTMTFLSTLATDATASATATAAGTAAAAGTATGVAIAGSFAAGMVAATAALRAAASASRKAA